MPMGLSSPLLSTARPSPSGQRSWSRGRATSGGGRPERDAVLRLTSPLGKPSDAHETRKVSGAGGWQPRDPSPDALEAVETSDLDINHSRAGEASDGAFVGKESDKPKVGSPFCDTRALRSRRSKRRPRSWTTGAASRTSTSSTGASLRTATSSTSSTSSRAPSTGASPGLRRLGPSGKATFRESAFLESLSAASTSLSGSTPLPEFGRFEFKKNGVFWFETVGEVF